MKRILVRSVVVSMALAISAGCGGDSEGPMGPAGESPEITFEDIEAGGDCEFGGTSVLVDGEPSASICNGASGDDGAPGEDGDTGAPGEDGDPGVTPEIAAERFADHADCDAGGLLVTVTLGEADPVETAICDGEDGEAGASPIVDVADIAADEAGECGLAGGYLVTITSADGADVTESIVCNGADGEGAPPNVVIEEDPAVCGDAGGSTVTIEGADPFTVCNGDEGAQGPEGTVDVVIGAPADCGDAGGISLQVGSEDPVDICNGEAGDGSGGNGEDGFSPIVDIVVLEPSALGPCVDGGVELTITSMDEFGDLQEQTAVICGAGEPIEVISPEIGFCNTQSPATVSMNNFEFADIYGQLYIEGFTDDADRDLPEYFTAELGAGPVADSPELASWEWATVVKNEAFDPAQNNDEYIATVGEFAAGDYSYLFRMRVDADDDWTYCGLDGIVDLGTYDAAVDAGAMDIVAVPVLPLGWTFEGDTPEEQLIASTGVGFANFSEFDEANPLPVGTSVFFAGPDWAADPWSEETTFRDGNDEIILDKYHRFAADFSGYVDLMLEGSFRTTSSSPRQLQIGVELDDGSVAFLLEPIAIASNTTQTYNIDLSREQFDNWSVGLSAEAFRFYPYEATSGAGRIRFQSVDFTGTEE